VAAVPINDVCGAVGFELCFLSTDYNNSAEAGKFSELSCEAPTITSTAYDQDS
jgi:hypothetical protein|tara:strand:+ start:2238 stop:2396 length:159 start_codon:yes stop_codon:yes gene_type:complete